MGIPVVTRECTPRACRNSWKPMRLPPRHEMRPDSLALHAEQLRFPNQTSVPPRKLHYVSNRPLSVLLVHELIHQSWYPHQIVCGVTIILLRNDHTIRCYVILITIQHWKWSLSEWPMESLRDWIQVSCIAGKFFIIWAIRNHILQNPKS